jgi:predicted DNA-binding protein YlxM (UPF0122 family)
MKVETKALVADRQLFANEIHRDNQRHLDKRALYLNYFNHIPQLLLITNVDTDKWDDYAAKLKEKSSKHYYKKCMRGKDETLKYEEDYFFMEDDLLISNCEQSNKVSLMWRHTDMSIIDAYKKEISRLRVFDAPKSTINLLVEYGGRLHTENIKLKKSPFNIEEHYNDDFQKAHETILNRLNKENDKGIVLLHGLPGTGKTSYIRSLITALQKKVIFLPPHMASSLGSPQLIPLILENTNSILVIEDAENIVIDRNQNGISPVSTILNMSDGLVSDCLNIQIICSFNTDLFNVDKALLRKGRLIAKYEFGKLETSKANTLSRKLGYDSHFTEPQVLTDVFNQEETSSTINVLKLVGFR